ncbi:P-II family nitrogen regulator [Bacillus sp. ISL-40]|uniref:P-II family nitrogen regulator n=1 Tax=Bacillus sp. ISL-40 TaxID=2819126 RepID=UPI001BEA3417|nr:P-II family nitrogen regulator [Bacillus sp. ISL-40]MBT2699175.1 P-II family nitrogen regulator [Bacillus sp. ISL-40]
MSEVLTKIEELKQALAQIEVSGITVTHAFGAGFQKGYTETYRGKKFDVNIYERIKVEIVVFKVPVQLVIDTARKVLNTGQPGDGKIFVHEIANVIKIRTGEEGYDALQNM